MTDAFDPKVSEALQKLLDQLSKESPELREVLDHAKEGRIDEAQAMASMMEIALSDPKLAARTQAMAGRALMPLREAAVVDPESPAGTGALFDSGVGLPQLNPLYEAALIERAQFDEDIPELRTGPMPAGAKPAVSVDTDARNPVALGQMLREASDQVGKKVAERRQKHLEAVSRIAEGLPLDNIVGDLEKLAEDVKDKGALVAAQGSAATDPAVYRRGKTPAPVKVARPKGSALALLSPEDRRKNAWKFLSTTQGRRTAVGTITALVLEQLQDAGLDVEPGRVEDKEGSTKYLWSVQLGEEGATQSSFSFIDVAARALGHGLLRQIEGTADSFILMVEPHNNLADHEVGWVAWLWRET